MRLIDADALKKHIQDDYNAIYKDYPDDLNAEKYVDRHAALRKKEVKEMCDWMCGYLSDKYTVKDVAPVRHGHWKKDYINDCARCSNCGRACCQIAKNYCAYCGAEMARSVVVSDLEITKS